MSWLTRSVVIVLILEGSAFAVRGPSRSSCVSCEIRTPSAFIEQNLGLRASSDWFMLDADKDGDWEVGILSDDSVPRVGIYDPSRSNWFDGPHTLQVSADLWYPVDWDGDGSFDYLYVHDLELRSFHPTTGTDSLLWLLPSPAYSVFAKPATDTLCATVAIGQVGTNCPPAGQSDKEWCIETSVFCIHGGTFLTSAGGSMNRPIPLPETSGWGSTLLIHYVYWWYASVPFSDDIFTDSQRMLNIGQEWSVTENTDMWTRNLTWYYPMEGVWRLRGSGIAKSARDGSLLYWMSSNSEESAFGSRGLQASTERVTWTDNISDSGHYAGISAFDFDQDGSDELILPFSDGGWERRNPVDGSIIDTLPNLPSARIVSYPVFSSGSSDLIYLKDSTLYIYRSPTPTSVLDDSSDVGSDQSRLAIIAHPNPFNAAVTLTWSRDASVSMISIHNILGQTIKTMDVSAADGSVGMTWDGCDEHGRPVASGVYFARPQSPKQSATVKIVLLR